MNEPTEEGVKRRFRRTFPFIVFFAPLVIAILVCIIAFLVFVIEQVF